MEKQLDSIRKNPMESRIHVLETETAVDSPEEELIRKHFLFELQSTLNLEQLLAIFFRHLNSILSCQGLDYRHESMRIFLRQGNRGRHRAEYRLTIGKEDLGEIRFSRRHPFTGDELQKMEILLGALLHPMPSPVKITLSHEEKKQLEKNITSRKTAVRLVER